jgi:hypothetical protein
MRAIVDSGFPSTKAGDAAIQRGPHLLSDAIVAIMMFWRGRPSLKARPAVFRYHAAFVAGE